MKTSIFKRSMALFLAFLLCFTTFIGSAVTPAFAAAAQSEVCVISFPRDGDANYSANWGHPDLNFTGGWHDKSTRFLSIHAVGSFTGEICYCIEPGVNVLIGDKVSQKDESFWDTKKEMDMLSRNIQSGLLPYWENILQKVMDYSNWSEKTRASIRRFVLPHVRWLQSEGYETFENVDGSVIRAYLIDCGKRMSPNSLDTIKRSIKKFYKFLFDTGKTCDGFQSIFSFPVPTEHKVKKPADLDEVAQVLSSINRETAIGKRDYAVILLAVVTGLRSIDITKLTFSEIDWANGEIIIIQAKTNQSVALPLTADVGQALQDYILNGRPQSTLQNIFLRACQRR